MIYVISKATFGSYNVRDIQFNANWDICPYSDYARIPDSMVDDILATKGYCDITLNSAGTEVTSYKARSIPSVPEECYGENTVLSVNGKKANTSGEVTLGAADVGARPSNWMPTAAQVGARPNNWMPSASDVGAVAKTALKSLAYSQTDANGDTTLSTLSAYPTTPGVFRVGAVISGLPSGISGYGSLVIFNCGTYYMHLYLDSNKQLYFARTTAMTAPATNAWSFVPFTHADYHNLGVRAQINPDGSTDFINPPMMPGVEYRTAERYQGKVVYRKILVYVKNGTVGDTSGYTDLSIAHGISGLTEGLRCVATAVENSNLYLLPYVSSAGGNTVISKFDSNQILLRTWQMRWSSPAFTFDLAYTKD